MASDGGNESHDAVDKRSSKASLVIAQSNFANKELNNGIDNMDTHGFCWPKGRVSAYSHGNLRTKSRSICKILCMAVVRGVTATNTLMEKLVCYLQMKHLLTLKIIVEFCLQSATGHLACQSTFGRLIGTQSKLLNYTTTLVLF
jgi:hypothetical protein